MMGMKIEIFLADTREHDCESLVARLNLDDLARLARIVHARRRAQFILGRALLRHALKSRFGHLADDWKVNAVSGKPRILGVGAPEISLSHSREQVACAIAPVAIGLDVEHCRMRDFVSLADQFCSPDALRALRYLPTVEQTEQFYRLWTLHEATIKLFSDRADALENGKHKLSIAHFRPGAGFIGTLVAATRDPIQLILSNPTPRACQVSLKKRR